MPFCSQDSLIKTEDYLPKIQRFLPNVGSIFVGEALRNTIKDLVAKSRNLNERIEITTQKGVSAYPVESLDCSEVIGIDSVMYMGRCLDPVDECDIPSCGCDSGCDRCRGYISSCCAGSGKSGYVTRPNDFIEIYPAPSRDCLGGLVVNATVTLSESACEFPKEFINKYPKALQYGVLSELFMMQSEAWYSMSTALRFQDLYEEQLKQVQADAFISNHPDGTISLCTRTSI